MTTRWPERLRRFVYEGVTHAGLCIVAADTGWVLLAQRAFDKTDAPDVRETWEFPGGSLQPDEDPLVGAIREFTEEMGTTLPPGKVVKGWRAPNGTYQGFVYVVETAFTDDSWVPTEEVQAVAWVPPLPGRIARDMRLRPEMNDFDWTLAEQAVSGNEEMSMTQQTTEPESPAEDAGEVSEEPELDALSLTPGTIYVHGVLAPEGVESGDQRGFSHGALTRRPLRLPLGWQKVTASGHDKAVTVGSIDRMMRKDGLIHWEGTLLDTPEADEYAGLLAHFGRYGVSIDGDKGQYNEQESKTKGGTWFAGARISGAVACSIQAFAEAYASLGPHPDMPDEFDADSEVLVAGARMEFDRGPGWVTNPEDTRRIHDYWTKPGQPGYRKIAWGTPGDFRRAKALIGEKILKNSPEKARFLNQIIAQWHFDALGYWPGDLGKPGNAPDTPENRRRAAVHAASIEPDAEGLGWEVVLTSSAGAKALPPASYFEFHEDSGATVIEKPDENGFRRTYGYAGEWGVCHIGKNGRCVEVPEDPTGDFTDFHLGRFETDEGYLNVGVVTYKVDHRDAEAILTETAEQQHFDNVEHAWAAVRLGQDDRGIWFSGVVLPHITDEDCVLIEAAGQVSGEWKFGSLRALQSVNVPGFPVLRSSAAYDEEGNILALVASMSSTSECEPTAFERMQALAQADAEVRFKRLKEQFNWTDVAEDLMDEAQEEGRVEPVGLRDDGAIVYEKDGEVPGTDTIVAPMPSGES